ncbi:hypothetical protein IRJ41_025971, partial [Triplophysa rosa]
IQVFKMKTENIPSQISALCSEDQEDTEAFIMATADQLLELIFCWIEEREHFADNLRKLAEELESLRKKCNVAECVGSSLTVLGAASLIGAGVATVFTFGAAAPLMGLASTCTNMGTVVSQCTKIIEALLSCSIMKKLQVIEKKSNEIAKKIQQILKCEKKEVNPSAEPDELEHHIMAEILRAIARQIGLNIQIIIDSMINDKLNHTEFPREKTSDMQSRGASGGGSSSAGVGRRSEGHFGDRMGPFDSIASQRKETWLKKCEMLIYSLVLSSVVNPSGVLNIIQHKSKWQIKLSDKVLFRSAGFQTTLIGGVMVVGGLYLMKCALPEMIDNWTKMIKGNHVTEASQSLRDTADEIQNATWTQKEQIKTTKKIFQEIKRKLQNTKEIEQEQQNTKEIEQEQQNTKETEQEESSEEETEDPPAVNVGLLNVRSIQKNKEKRIKIKNIITKNNLHVFLMTETWLKDNTACECLEEASPPEFFYEYTCRDVDKRGGGVSIQFSQKLHCQRIPFDSSITTFEYVGTALRHNKWDEEVLFINVYRPERNTEQFEKFTGEFQTLLKEACKRYESIIVAGDFNDRAEYYNKMLTIMFNMIHYSSGFVQHVDKPTHKAGGTLDLVLSRNVEVLKLNIRDDEISDHYTIYFSIRPTLPQSKDAKTKANRFKKE